MRQILKNGAEIIRGQGVEIGLMQTEELGNPEAWLYWLEGQGITQECNWRRCKRTEAIAHLNTWLGNIGLALQDGKIVEF